MVSENWSSTNRIKFVETIHLRKAKSIILIGRIKEEDKADLDRIEKTVGINHDRCTLTNLRQPSEQDNG